MKTTLIGRLAAIDEGAVPPDGRERKHNVCIITGNGDQEEEYVFKLSNKDVEKIASRYHKPVTITVDFGGDE